MFSSKLVRAGSAAAALGGIAFLSLKPSLSSHAATTYDHAVVILGPLPSQTDSGCRGTVHFRQARAEGAPTRVTVKATGLRPGPHGIHIHALGDLTKGCASAGGHFNPFNAPHGGRDDPAQRRHVGDLGNIVADAAGGVEVEFDDALLSLRGPLSIVGRSVVIHSDEDDLGRGPHADSATTGHSGARIACGVIGLAETS